MEFKWAAHCSLVMLGLKPRDVGAMVWRQLGARRAMFASPSSLSKLSRKASAAARWLEVEDMVEDSQFMGMVQMKTSLPTNCPYAVLELSGADIL